MPRYPKGVERPSLGELRQRRRDSYRKHYYESGGKLRDRGRYLRRTYGITLEEYQRMLEEQGGVCAICERPETRMNRSGTAQEVLCVDHDHETGEVRGLLCHDCNTALGKFGDDPQVILRAAAYLIPNS